MRTLRQQHIKTIRQHQWKQNEKGLKTAELLRPNELKHIVKGKQTLSPRDWRFKTGVCDKNKTSPKALMFTRRPELSKKKPEWLKILHPLRVSGRNSQQSYLTPAILRNWSVVSSQQRRQQHDTSTSANFALASWGVAYIMHGKEPAIYLHRYLAAARWLDSVA